MLGLTEARKRRIPDMRNVPGQVDRPMVASLIAKAKDQGFLLSDDIVAYFPNAEDQVERLDELYTSLVA